MRAESIQYAVPHKQFNRQFRRRRERRFFFAIDALEPRRLLSASLTPLYAFGAAGPTDAAYPDAGLIMDSAGNLYGTTYEGGKDNVGTVFEISAGTDQESVLYSFSGGSDGANPIGGLVIDTGGNLYGTTQYGGNLNSGTVFEIPADHTTDKILYAFQDDGDGANPTASLTLDGTNLFGTTSSGGEFGNGAIFTINILTSDENTLYSFTGADDGALPNSCLTLDSQGNLFGTTEYGGVYGGGTLFELSTGSTQPQTLYSFSGGSDGAFPLGGVTLDASGNLYGTTSSGGADDAGTIFELMSGATSDTVLYTFTGNDDGATPYDPTLLSDTTGNLFGTTAFGGEVGDGTIFELPASSTQLTTLYSFSGGNDGAIPLRGLISDYNGNLYGTAHLGGANGLGNVFELSVAPPGFVPDPDASYTITGPIGGPQTLGITAGSATLTSDLSDSLGNYTLSLSGDAAVTLAADQSAGAISMLGAATLNIASSTFTINYPNANSSPIATIQQYLADGYDSGTWTGPGIISTTAADTPGLSVGYADGSVDPGTPAGNDQLLIKCTLAGDANLDGNVDFNDLFAIGKHLNTTGNDWADGNFNCSTVGAVDFNDLFIVGQNLNKSINSPAATSIAAPTTAMTIVASSMPPTTTPASAIATANLYTFIAPPLPTDPQTDLFPTEIAAGLLN